jgi:hypothetical protein
LKSFTREREGLGRLTRELGVLAGLEGRVPRLLDDGRSDSGPPYIVVEWLVGEDLARVLEREQRLSPPDAADVALSLAETLGTLHERGFIHRDIKPSNVLVPLVDGRLQFRQAYLLDFGLAGILHEVPGERAPVTHTSSIVGTPLFMSPEQITGQPLRSTVDIWGVGALLHKMLTGETPFQAASFPALMEQIVQVPLRGQPDLDPRLWALIANCLRKSPDARLQTAEELRARLESIRADPIPLRSVAMEPAATGLRRLRGPQLPSSFDALTIAVVSAAAFGIATAMRIHQEQPALDTMLGLVVAFVGIGSGSLYREWCLERRLRPARPVRALRRRATELQATGGVLTESLAIDVDDVLRILEENGADALNASAAIKLFHRYDGARQAGDDDTALAYVPELLAHVEATMPWWVARGPSIERGLRVAGVLVALCLVLRAAWIGG